MKFYEFEIKIFKKNVKHLRLKVAKNGDISLNVPLFTSQKSALEFLELNLSWLRKTTAKIKQNSINANEILYKGQKYKLSFDENINGVKIWLFNITAKDQASLQDYLTKQAKIMLNAYISHYAKLINKPIKRVSFKKMKTRWGSCNHKKAYINLNTALIHKDPKFAEYVVLHELAHLRFNHHQKSFYDYIATFMPDYKERIKLA